MQSKPNSNDLARLKRMAQSQAGQQLLTALQKSGGQELQDALAKAAAGDYTQAQQAISAFLSTPEAQKWIKELENG